MTLSGHSVAIKYRREVSRSEGRPMPLCARCFGAAIGHFSSPALSMAGIVLPVSLCIAFLVAPLRGLGTTKMGWRDVHKPAKAH